MPDVTRRAPRCATLCLLTLIAATPGRPAIASHTADLPAEPDDAGWTLYADNDRFSLTESDANYTAGFSLVLSGQRARKVAPPLDNALGRINDWFGLGDLARREVARTYHSFGFGGAAFTPEAIRDTAPRYDQRPYACLIFLQNTHQTVAPARRTSYFSTLVAGLLGTSACESSQHFVHHIANDTRVRGWAHQISDGGEPTLLWRGARQRLLYEDLAGTSHHQITWTADTQLGYITDLGTGISWRWGNLRSPWWSFAPQQVESVPFGTPHIPRRPLRTGQPVESYVWAGGMLRYRFYNALLQGQFRESDVRVTNERLEPLVAEIWFGIAQEFRNGYQLSLSIRARSREFRGPRGTSIKWGSLALQRQF